jgi:hypothetical protein
MLFKVVKKLSSPSYLLITYLVLIADFVCGPTSHALQNVLLSYAYTRDGVLSFSECIE